MGFGDNQLFYFFPVSMMFPCELGSFLIVYACFRHAILCKSHFGSMILSSHLLLYYFKCSATSLNLRLTNFNGIDYPFLQVAQSLGLPLTCSDNFLDY